MTIPKISYTGNGVTKIYTFPFPYLEASHIKVTLNGSLTTAFTLVNANSIGFNTAPGSGVQIVIFRETPSDEAEATIFSGSAIRASDLNRNTTQQLYISQETQVVSEEAQVKSTQASTDATQALASASQAAGNAATALSTANTAASNAQTALNTANTAASNATTALSTANAAASNAQTALNTANSASTNAANALSTANTAASNAQTALATSNTAATNAQTALTTANTAKSTADNAALMAGDADGKADLALANSQTAVAAVSAVTIGTPVNDLAALLALTPTNGSVYEVRDSTGVQSSSSITGVPVGFTGSTGLTVTLSYSSSTGKFSYVSYRPNDPETRYAAKAAEANAANALSAANQAVTKADTSLLTANNAASIASSAQTTANTANTNATNALNTANTAGTNAQTALNTANTANTNASNALSKANSARNLALAALPTTGGTMTGPLQLPFGDKSNPSLTWGVTGTGFFRPQPEFGTLGLAVNSIVRRLWNFDGDEAHNSETFSTATDYRVIKYNGPIGTILRFFSNETQVGEIWNDTTALRISSLLGGIRLITAGIDRLRINSSGSWGIGPTGGSFGQAGQVFTTNGSTSPPTWTDKISITEFTTNTLWTKPTTGRIVKVKLWGAGGSGGRRGSAGGGGGGAYIEKEFLLSELPDTVQITIGIGGASRSTDGDGFDGTATTFGSLLSAAGGKGGVASNNFSFGGSGADAFNISGGTIGGSGGAGSNPGREGFWGGGGGGGGDTAAATAGGSSVYGGGGGAGRNDGNVRAGGASQNGGSGASSNTGATGGFPGGGGGASNSTSGAGANGKCVIEVI